MNTKAEKGVCTLRCKLITTVSDPNHPGFKQLLKSLEKFKWDAEIIMSDYHGYGTKMVNAYNCAKETDCTHLFIVDAHDVVVLGTMEEALSKMPTGNIVFNAEKCAWPYSEWALLYPEVVSEWKYLNGGVAFVSVPDFIEMFEQFPILPTDNDQVILAKAFLTAREAYGMTLDNNCQAFQSYAFISEDDYSYENGRIQNLKTKTEPVFIHGNGKTDMTKVYELL